MNRKVEILAPAGSYEGMRAAVLGGCDAVYIGGKYFGARAFADNLEEDIMKAAIDYMHLHGKKLYMTVNTLLKNQEMEERLYQYLFPYYEQGLDAVIVQDIGVMSFIHKYFPAMHIHASTQMTLTSEKGTKWMSELGVNRFVTSRELTLEEIRKIRQETELEIESFVHGALCYSYSGQCFMSSFLGGRSGNRGKCAQPCRKQYEFYENEKKYSNGIERYLLSPKDICTIEMIPDLVDAGIDSFKIEGRMKRPEYAAYTAYLYRKYTDLYLELGRTKYEAYLKEHSDQWHQNRKELMDLYNRGGFTKGYYMNYNGKDMMSLERPNHNGVCIGTVLEVKNSIAKYRLQEPLSGQDVLEFRSEKGERLYEYTVKEDTNTKVVEARIGHDIYISKGTKVYRTRSNRLLNQIQNEIIKKELRYPIQGYFTASEEEEMQFTAIWKEYSVTVSCDKAEKAQNQPISKEKIEKQLKKTNDTIFYFDELQIHLEGNLFIPVGKLNQIRRMTIEALEGKILSGYRRTAVYKEMEEKEGGMKDFEVLEENRKRKNFPELAVSVCTYEQFEVIKSLSDIDAVYLSMAVEEDETILKMLKELKEKQIVGYLMLPTILRRKEYEAYEKAFLQKTDTALSKILSHSNVKGYIIKNYEEAVLLTEVIETKFPEKELILDYNIYTWNDSAKEYFRKKGIERTTASIELGYELWKESNCEQQDIIIYGHMPLMTSVQCVVKNVKGCQNVHGVYELKDEQKRKFYVNNCCKYCYNLIYTGEPVSLHGQLKQIKELNPYRLRIDFTVEQPETVKERMREIVSFLNERKKDLKNVSYEYTLGHFKKGVL